MPVNIYVDIGKASGNIEGTRTNLLDNEELSKEENPQVLNSKSKSTSIAAATMIASGTLNYVTSNLGSWSGNQQVQSIVNKVSTGVQIGAMALASPVTAATYVGLQLATTAIDENTRRRRESVSVAQARARAGYTTDAASYRKR